MKLEVLSKSDNQEILNRVMFLIGELINVKNLEPGDKLPSERMLAEKFNVSRSLVREAISKLEFFGLLKSIPQSGTFVADIGVVAMNGMIDFILKLDDPDFKALVETRILLELKIVKLAALRRTEEDLVQIENALKAYEDKVKNGNQPAVQEDLLFHLAIANASGNSTLNLFMLKITPEIITNFKKYHVCSNNLTGQAADEHREIYNAIKLQDPQLAKTKMKEHFKMLYQYCYNIL
ncbi:FadR/GntR family transcriptional regulator [Formosa haliotis]|uniref:FadR/GntR family transcriptional regulator n=1 Tax=Formosa haliotis TaxID=1555194 RepID=UPI000825D906|nr:FadR/GntR family transcriptional regulator [Formosa haliotis]